ncbi:phytoene/squalene synthase family protein [Corynebacterium lizhenjunii]|uniref:Phytoene/squalene synthase family protein n=1 Tax=Corynebacterium lizhenjunii TaxID=2709394 RepID=A0A7T0KF78_9CORY|nr:phytoene/squalene synthase family protein [Corynebacterium lizhenjunii]QPK78859.1 phytoene/squalene synthase family protein [Corynebacterium lizhenjunii]
MPAALRLYDATACRAATQVLAGYSTSFSAATRLLGPRMRRDVANLYAVVRIADEIVDGAADQDVRALLDSYERAVLAAPAQRFHTDPVLHAYALTARRCGFAPQHLQAFFASMRQDIDTTMHTPSSLESYIYGSAEVIGLLCLDIFLADAPCPTHRPQLEAGARRLGAAFQKINFLRDLGADSRGLGRTYFPQLRDHPLDADIQAGIIADIRADLAAAAPATAMLPLRPRCAVTAATAVFTQLADTLAATPPAELTRTRVRVSNPRKLLTLATSLRRTH